jgi:beta-glucosidase
VSTSIPSGFLLGAATSAYQIEGAVDVEGRGRSIWDTFAKQPGAIVDGSDGSDACAHHRLWREDVELMHWLGLDAYRFSIAWPRILPSGRGTINTQGLDFYERLVDSLLEHEIRPFVTLYHWDLPQALEERGGWRARDTAHAFVEYADVVSRRLGDRVKHWITHNEPWCTAMHGHVHGEHAPGRRDWLEGLTAAHHVLLSHGWAVPAIRANVPDAELGITLNFTYCEPASDSERCLRASRARDGFYNRWYIDPLYGRGYPDDVVDDHVAHGRLADTTLPFVREGDLAAIAVPTDLLGVNYYTRERVTADDDGQPKVAPALLPRTDIGWEIYAEGLTRLLVRLQTEYRPASMYVTESGAAFHTAPNAQGEVHDHERRQYLTDHLQATLTARDQGARVRGYFVWSLLDNYEWAEGYTQRFGIVWVDYQTQRRLPKASAIWYRELTRTRNL